MMCVHQCSFASKRKYPVPVVLHVDNGPAHRLGGVERLVEAANGGMAVIGPFPLGVGVVHDKGEAGAAASLGPFEHLQAAVGIAESRDRLPAYLHMDVDGLAGLVVDEIE